MTFTNLVSALRRVALRADRDRDCGLLPVRQFQQVLARERARSDRSGDRFCLLTFSSSERTNSGALYEELPAILKHRLRATDEVGGLDSTRIGGILPGAG